MMLNSKERKELRHAILCANPSASEKEREEVFLNLADIPKDAREYIRRVNFAINAMAAK